jgi:class 3 adenylate cyclase
MPLGANRVLPRLPLTVPQQSAKLLPVPPAWLVWSFGGRRDRPAGSKAILAADVVGYSALMERDEEATYAEF